MRPAISKEVRELIYAQQPGQIGGLIPYAGLVLDVETHVFRFRELAQVVVTEAHRWVFGNAVRPQT